jgi:hypothetical protein
MKMERSTLWSFGGPEFNTTPHLVICMADRVDTESSGSVRPAQEEAATRLARNTISRPVGSAASGNRAKKRDPGVLVPPSLFVPAAGGRGLTSRGLTYFQAEGTNRPQVIERSPDQAGAKVCSLLDDVPALGSFRYEYRIKYSLSKQWLTDSDSFTHEKSSSARPSSGATGRTMRQAGVIMLIIATSRSAQAN